MAENNTLSPAVAAKYNVVGVNIGKVYFGSNCGNTAMNLTNVTLEAVEKFIAKYPAAKKYFVPKAASKVVSSRP